MQKWWNWVLGVALFALLIVFLQLAITQPPTHADLKPMFDDYLKQFNKSYKSPAEYETRLKHFVASVQEIETLNAAAHGPESYRAHYGLTPLSDMSKAEFKDIHLSDERVPKPPRLYGKSWSKFNTIGVDSKESVKEPTDADAYDVDSPNASHQRNRSCGNEPHDNIYIIIRKRRDTLPMKVDWREKGVVGLIRDQGLCGACWAFSTIATMESMAAIKTGKLDTLSVQEVIDCAGLGNAGCAGGDICLLLDWLSLTRTVVEPESKYPLKNTDGACKAAKNATGVTVKSFTCDDFVSNEEKILEALATHGPVAVAVNALSWQHYLGGVIQFHCSGSVAELNHAVQLVGYDLTGDVPHYLARNSWGAEFGLAGYLKLAVGGNVCGLANEVATIDVN